MRGSKVGKVQSSVANHNVAIWNRPVRSSKRVTPRRQCPDPEPAEPSSDTMVRRSAGEPPVTGTGFGAAVLRHEMARAKALVIAVFGSG